MHDLIPLGPALPGALSTAEIDATMAYAEAEKALATRAAYASDWRDFAAWCASRGATALPAHQGIVAAYLSGLADSGRKASTIGRRAAAIGYHHKMAGYRPRKDVLSDILLQRIFLTPGNFCCSIKEYGFHVRPPEEREEHR